MKTYKEFLSETVEHEHIKQELGNKDVNVHSFHPNAYKGKTHIEVTGDHDVVDKANEHLKHLGVHKEYHAVHKTQSMGSAPSIAKSDKAGAYAGD